MTYLELTLIATTLLLLVCCLWMAYKLYTFGILILNVQDTLEESIEVLDDKVDSMERILAIPLFSDSPEIKSLRNDMISCREATLDIAYSLSSAIKKQESSPEIEDPQ